MSNLSPAWMFTTDAIHPYAYWEEYFSPEECQTIIDYGKSQVLEEGVINTGDTSPSQVKEIRDSKVVFLQPDENMQWVYRKLTDVVQHLNKEYFMFDLTGFAEGLQFTEYTAPGGNYNFHVDSGYNKVIRKLSIVLQLSDESDYEGGDFIIRNSSKDQFLQRKQGTILAFPSYTVHKVSPVTKGTRHSLVGWITGPRFK